MNKKIYLDNNATTIIDKDVLKIICDDFYPANPSSTHFFGRLAKKNLLEAKSIIAKFLKVEADSLIFTSGGTEAVNLAIRGLIENLPKSHIIATKTDHACVYNTLKYLEKKGHEITYLESTIDNVLNENQIKSSIKENTKLIVTSYVNSETGLKIDIEKTAALAKQLGIYLAIDGVAALGKELFNIPDGVTTMAFSSHKIHGPKGIGLCYVKKNIKMSPILFGGPQENQIRPGTENLSAILGFAKAVDLLNDHLPKATENMRKLRDHFEASLKAQFPEIKINGTVNRICNVSNICFTGIDAENLLILLDQNNVMASYGSACASGSATLSRALLNLGIDPKDVKSSIRFSLSRNTTIEEIDEAIKIIIKLVQRLKK
ncbi:MAG: cysteine desulfurase family protein [Parachlamydiales bacterium]|jgi:cysteine desulfurase